MKIFNKKTAFTLAELLITIGVIGALAALTIPTLNNRVGDQENIARFRAMYTRLESALNTAQVNKIYKCFNVSRNTNYFNNLSDDVDLYPSNGNCYTEDNNGNRIGLIPDMMTILGSERIINFADFPHTEEFRNSELGKYRTALETEGVIISRMYILKDGSFLMMQGRPRFTNIMTSERYAFYIDTNGAKKPNMLGKDLFHMSFYVSDVIVTHLTNGDVRYSPRQVTIYPYDIDASDDDPQIRIFKRAIGAKS